MFSTKHCFEKIKKTIGHHSRLRDVMGQSYPIYACTNANHARYSSLQITYCDSLKHALFLEHEAQMDQKNYGTMLFMSKQVSLPKISSILQKMKIGQNSIYALFVQRPSNVILGEKLDR